MTENANQSNSTSDKIANLTREAENLKLKLEEERQKLNDVARKLKKNNNNNEPTNMMTKIPQFICFPFLFLQFHLWPNAWK